MRFHGRSQSARLLGRDSERNTCLNEIGRIAGRVGEVAVDLCHRPADPHFAAASACGCDDALLTHSADELLCRPVKEIGSKESSP
jgi:hypothetical protein